MHQTCPKSLWLQIALWTEPYTNPELAPNRVRFTEAFVTEGALNVYFVT